jgi:tRNA(fMet)-specific endonuclease VapC
MKYLLKYLLDTNACIKYLNFPDSSIRRKIEITPNNEIAVCSIVKAELFYGSKKSKNPTLNLAKHKCFF